MAQPIQNHSGKAPLRQLLDGTVQERDLLQTVIDSINDEIWITDRHGNFTLVNQSGLLEFDLDGRQDVEVGSLANALEVFRSDGSPRPVDEAPPLRALKGEIIRNEVEIVRTPRERELRYREVNSTPLRDAGGAIIGSVSVVRDVTTGKRTAQALQMSEIMYRTLFEGSKTGILVADVQTKRFHYANPAICAMLGYTPDEFQCLGVADIHPPADLPDTMAAFDEMLQGTRDLVETRCLRKNGGVLDVSISSSIATVNGHTHAFGFFTDITERRRTQDELERSRILFAEAERIGKVGGWEFDIDTMRQRWTDEVYHIHEVDPSYEPTVEEGIDFYTPESRPVIERAVQRAIELGEPFDVELEIVTAKGNLRWVHAIGRADLEHRRIYGFFQDITGRKRTENALRHSEEMLNATQRLSKVGGWEWDIERQSMLCTEETRRIHDADPGQTQEGTFEDVQRWVECYDPEDRPVILAAFQRCAELGEPYDLEFPFTTFAGRRLWIRTTGQAVWDGNRIVKVVGNIADITVQKQAEETLRKWNQTLEHRVAERTKELRQSEARFRQLAETTFEGIAISKDGILTDVNTQLAALLGYESDEMLGRPVTDFVAPEARDSVAQRLREGQSIAYESSCLRKDGTSFPAEIHGRMGIWQGQPSRITALRDLTASKLAAEKLQAQQTELEQSHRLSLISEVSAGIIHQIGQPLCAMGANLAVVMAKLSACKLKSCGSLEIIKEIEAEVDNMREVVIHMRKLAQDSRSKCAPMDPNVMLDSVLPLLRQEAATRGIRLEARLQGDLPAVVADAVQLNQVILILVRNAFDACADCPPERRAVTVMTRSVAGAGVELAVSDAGTGIAPEVMDRLFEPFFSTKAEGLGIGLRLSRTIVEAHGGSIQAANNGHGATFRVTLPASAAV